MPLSLRPWPLALLGLVACKTPPSAGIAETGAPAPAPSTFIEIETVVDGSRMPDSSGAPLPGLDYWARPRQTPDQFVAGARAGGLELRHEVEVHDARELVAALAPNTLIWLYPGRYVLQDSDTRSLGRADPPDWSSLSRHYDEGEIHDLHDLALVGVGPRPALIIQPDSYAPVLSFVDVKDLALYNLALGHRPEQGWCQGGVIRAVECQNVLIEGTTLFGSGTEGLSLVTVEQLSLRDSVITDCSEQFSTISNSRSIRYERVEIAGNRSELLRGFAIYHSLVTLDEVSIHDNHPLQWTSEDSYNLLFAIDGSFDWGEWFVRQPRALEPAIPRSQVELRATRIEGERHDQSL